MIPSLLLLSAGVVATPVIVSEVKATREAGHLRVDVRADGGIDPEAAKTRIDQGNLYLFLGGARVKADNRAWKLDEGVGEIRAHRHHTETELDIPLLGNGCSGPVELQGTPTGLTALVGCEGPAVAPQGRTASAQAAKPPLEKPSEKAAPNVPLAKTGAPVSKKPQPAASETVAPAIAAKAAAPTAEAAALKSLVALPPSEEDEAADEKVAPAPTEDKTKDDKVLAAAAKPAGDKVASAPVAAKDVTENKAPALSIGSAAPAELPVKSSSVAPSGMRAVGLPALFLAGLAVAAYFFARKKRALGTTRRIQILETASLGPKRSLVIARVGEETLVLGASEAGITLLQSSDGAALAPKSAAAPARPVAETSPAEAPAAAAKPQIDEGPSELDQSLIDALADVPEPDGIAPAPARGSFRSIEGGLASLFGRKAAATAAARVEPKVATTFDDLLEDSVEDQELRRKLAAGMSARVR